MQIQGTGDSVQDWRAFTARRVVANAFHVAESDLIKPTRATADVAFARQVAMYLAHVVYSLSYREVAAAFIRERSTVAHACALVEDARDDADFDALMDRLELRLSRLDRIRSGRLLPKSERMRRALAWPDQGASCDVP